MHFTPIRQLGVGGMAVATLARDEAGRLVVLKRSLAGRPSDDKALRDEGRLGQLLDHPALVKTLGVIEEDGHPCLVLDYIPGLSLQALRSCGPLAPGLCCVIGHHIAEALSTIHTAENDQGHHLGMLHRDVTPANILVSLDGQPKLIDLGIARALDSTVTKTSTGELRGTLRFLAPELFADAKQSTATDLWAMGVSLLEAALGAPLFRGSTHEILLNIVRKPPLESIDASRLDPRLTAALRPLLEPDPALRDADARISAARFAEAALSFSADRAALAVHVRASCATPPPRADRRDAALDQEPAAALDEESWSSLLDARAAVSESTGSTVQMADRGRQPWRRGFIGAVAAAAAGLAGASFLLLPNDDAVVEGPPVRPRLEDLAPSAVLVPRGLVWRYDDTGLESDGRYTAPDFDDSQWKTGPAPLGYGDDTITTVISYGSDPKRKHSSALFRATFDVKDPASFGGVRANIVFDDGVLLTLNGREVARDGLPPGATLLHWATKVVDNDHEHKPLPFFFSAERLRTGRNVIAVQVHQHSPISTDLEFDLELVGLRLPSPP
jgi:hypothetical protein